MSTILGISAFFHDSAASIIKDGEIIAAAQEERFSRKKHDERFPVNAINYVLSEAKVRLNDVEKVVFFEKPFLKFERLLETYMAFAPRGLKSFSLAMPIWLREKLFQKKYLFDLLNKIDKNFKNIEKIKFSEHHFSHAASAFYPSPFDEAVILTLDGVGEWATTTLALGKNNKIEMLKEIHFPHSLGLLYSAFTYYTGFKVNSGEYKLMGLAAYNSEKYGKDAYNIFAETLQVNGINSDTHLVAYDDDGGVYASRFWWMLNWIGHHKVSILNGGLKAWIKSGNHLENTKPVRRKGQIQKKISLVHQWKIAEISAWIESEKNND